MQIDPHLSSSHRDSHLVVKRCWVSLALLQRHRWAGTPYRTAWLLRRRADAHGDMART
jgi:hypothetical protein